MQDLSNKPEGDFFNGQAGKKKGMDAVANQLEQEVVPEFVFQGGSRFQRRMRVPALWVSRGLFPPSTRSKRGGMEIPSVSSQPIDSR